MTATVESDMHTCETSARAARQRESTAVPDRAEQIASDPRWAEIRTRSRAADGAFLYSVRTTGVYCRPSCAARLPRPENVEFHATREDAERAGFRACHRCRPDRSEKSLAGADKAKRPVRP